VGLAVFVRAALGFLGACSVGLSGRAGSSWELLAGSVRGFAAWQARTVVRREEELERVSREAR
jgi:hypothetical protein